MVGGFSFYFLSARRLNEDAVRFREASNYASMSVWAEKKHVSSSLSSTVVLNHMTLEGQKFYPGDGASAGQVIRLADEYRRASESLLDIRLPGLPISQSPYRLVAIHAIELYLNALLIAAGHTSGKIRGLQHDLNARVELALTTGIKLRRRTIEHLRVLSQNREYLITRYDPEPKLGSQLNRIQATIKDVAEKVAEKVAMLRPEIS